ncbi:MAG: NADH-quinone oxidoreductase subunit B family protein [Chloroflexota bacterium]|nr:NADH-quinone oxidoreductase subunit B family protein [Chloroflexota bacterium]
MLESLTKWSRVKSPWVCHLNTGGCNGCDIETLAALMPRFDIERFGILLKGTPRHADVLLCCGPITRQMKNRAVRIYEQMPDPKFVIAIGSCACSGDVFWGCYNVLGGIDKAIPVNVYIPGCPPRPDAIIHGVVKLLGDLDPSYNQLLEELKRKNEIHVSGE